MKTRIKPFLLAFLILLSTFACACSQEDGSGYTFKYTLLADPKNLDPQMATDEASIVVLANLFQGLLVANLSGTVSEGVAESYTVSSDGLTYNFKIREGIKWQSSAEFEADLTAHDFVFAFQRLIKKSTNSPYASDFMCIKNAVAVNKSGANASILGVKALGDYELEITLDYANADFLYLLTTPPAYPCNEEFFNLTKGKYGLESDAVASNGAFYLQSWLYDPYGKDNYLILRRNVSYNLVSEVFPYSVNYFVQRGNEDKKYSDFVSGETDIFDSNGTHGALFDERDLDFQAFETKSAGLVFNTAHPLYSILEVRQALAFSIDRTAVTTLPDTVRTASGIVPSAVAMLNKSFRELSAEPAVASLNISLAQLLWESSMTQLERSSLDGTTIIVPDDFVYSEYLSEITKQWQENLGFYCGYEVLPKSEYEKRISEGKYAIALAELTASHNTPSDFFDYFKTGESANIFGISFEELDAILETTHKSASLSACVKAYSNAESYLINNQVYLPLFYENEYLFFNSEIKDVRFDPFTRQIFFEKAKKF